MFSPADFARLATVLAGLRGKFVLSLNDVPEVRRIFAAFRVESVETSYFVAGEASARGRVGELLISNRGLGNDLFGT